MASEGESIPPISSRLPTELWGSILEPLRWESPASLGSLSLSCHAFRQIALPFLFQTLRIHFAKKGNRGQKILREAADCSNSELLSHVRVFDVSGGYTYEKDVDGKNLCRLVPRLENVQIIRWRLRRTLPPSIIESLDRRDVVPQVFFEGGPHSLLGGESTVAGCQCIHSLSIVCDAYHYAEGILGHLKQFVCSLPALERLTVKCTSDMQEPPFTLEDSDTLPALKALHLTNFAFVDGQAEAWARCLQTSHMRHLVLDGDVQILGFLQQLTGRVSGLTFLSLRITKSSQNDETHLCDTLDAFLGSITNLQEFTAFDLPKSTLSILTLHHGHNLRQLEFRETEMVKSSYPQRRSVFSFGELTTLAGELSAVERLAIDLLFKERLSYDVLSGIAHFPRLSHLELNTYFPLDTSSGINGESRVVSSWLNESIAEEAFRYVAGESKHYRRTKRDPRQSEPTFKALDIKVGEWEPVLSTIGIHDTSKNYLYACRWDGLKGVETMRIFCKAQPQPCEISRYRQALASVGLESMFDMIQGTFSM